MIMVKKLQILGVFLMVFCSQKIFSQQNSNNNGLEFKSENATRNSKEGITTYTGNVSVVSPYIKFDDAEKVIVDENKNELKIYKPKTFKIIHLESLSKKAVRPEDEPIIYKVNTKELMM